MHELIVIKKTVIGEEEVNSVDARELHSFLGSKQEFAHWIDTKVVNNPFFVKNVDFMVFDNIIKNSKGGRPRTDYALTIDTAKKVAMSEQTERGNEVRNYFLECEKKLEQVKSIYDTKHVPNQIKDVVEIQLLTTKYLSEMLRYSDVSTLGIVHKINESHGIPTNYLPQYVSNQRVHFSATDLLKKNKIKMSVQKFNKILEQKGFIETKQRRSTSSPTGYKNFKCLTKSGLQFGLNDVSPTNPNETQPHYFEDTFMDFFDMVTNDLAIAA